MVYFLSISRFMSLDFDFLNLKQLIPLNAMNRIVILIMCIKSLTHKESFFPIRISTKKFQ